MKLQLLKLLIMCVIIDEQHTRGTNQSEKSKPRVIFFAKALIASASADRDANLKQSITIKTSADGKHERQLHKFTEGILRCIDGWPEVCNATKDHLRTNKKENNCSKQKRKQLQQTNKETNN